MQQRGFIKMTLLIVAGLVLLKYAYQIDVVGFLTEGPFKEYLDKSYKFGQSGWQKYREVLTNLWNYFINIIKTFARK